MRENRKLTTKRRAGKASVWKTLHASVKQKKQRAAAIANSEGMEFQSDVPNLSISRALIVLLVLHVIAIGGMYAHNKWFADSGQPAVVTATPEAPAVEQVAAITETPISTATIEPVVTAPVQNTGYELYVVASNDSYESIASSRDLDAFELRRINSNRVLRSGSVLRLPGKMVKPAVTAAAPVKAVADAPPANPVPEAATAVAAIAQNIEPVAEYVDEPVVAQAVPEPVVAEMVYADYKIRSGDTFWKLSRKFNVSVNEIVAANKNVNPSKLKLGQKVRIPQ